MKHDSCQWALTGGLELSVLPMLVFPVFFLFEWKQMSLAPWAEDDEDYEVHKCFVALASKWK